MRVAGADMVQGAVVASHGVTINAGDQGKLCPTQAHYCTVSVVGLKPVPDFRA